MKTRGLIAILEAAPNVSAADLKLGSLGGWPASV